MPNARLNELIARLDFARAYNLKFVEGISETDWYRFAEGNVTHLAWQFGHLAVAEYRLIMGRVVGEERATCEILPSSYSELFGKGSIPREVTGEHPRRDELLTVLSAVHQEVKDLLPTVPESVLAEASLPEHSAFQTKLEVVRWCVEHEFIHSGQIALLRRQLGYASLR
ncbi:MAG: DinB family protein [Planctomycetaceae bacterium]|nr:DinB family protein [Planctomycetaceae bacterium]